MRRSLKIMRSWIVLLVLAASVAHAADASRSAIRGDLAGTGWENLPSTKYPGFTLPLSWKDTDAFEFRLFRADAHDQIAMIVHRQQDRHTIVSAVAFTDLKEHEWLEHDCYFSDLPLCDGRVCDGILIGLVSRSGSTDSTDTYVPVEAWHFARERSVFEAVPVKNVICRPQGYAN